MLNKDSSQKILNIGKGEPVNRWFLDFFKAMAKEAVIKDAPSVTLVVPMYDEQTNPALGEYLAELHFVVRKHTDGPIDCPAQVDTETNAQGKS